MQNYLKNIFISCLLGMVLCTIELYSQTLTNANRYFSPNLDGKKDFVEIPFEIKEENLQKWSLIIVRKEGEVFKRVKTIESLNPKEEQLTFAKFFSRLVAKDAPLSAPNSYLWEGRDDKGNLVPDGIYYFTIRATDRWGNDSQSPFIPLVVDSVNPEANLILTTDIFSPNGDYRKDELPLSIKTQKFNDLDKWVLAINDEEGETVKTFTSSKKSTDLDWDGKSENGEEVPEGTYELTLQATDLAGNESTLQRQKVSLVREYETANLEVSQPSFSPNGDGYFDSVSFETALSSTDGMEEWRLDINNEAGEVVKSFSDPTLQKVIYFDGLDDDGYELADGRYQSQLIANFRSGNQPRSSVVPFVIDTEAPEISVKLRNQILNPNALSGGYRDLLVTHTYPLDENNTYQISILKQNNDPVLQQSYITVKLPEQLVWDGKNQQGQVLPGKYVYILKAKDEVGNISVAASEPFDVIDENVKVEVFPDYTSISPNGDRKLDTISFTFSITEQYREILTNGVFSIYDEKNIKVSEYAFTKLPKILVWDGTRSIKDSTVIIGSEEVLPDGIYYYDLKTTFTTKEVVTLPKNKLYLDTTPVALDILPHDTIFSPNGDGNLERIYFTNRYTKSALKPEADEFTVLIEEVEDGRTTIYRRKEWRGDLPEKISWNGKDQVEEDSPSGMYRMKIETVDHAQNQATYLSEPFELVREIETLNLNISPEVVSSIKAGSPNKFFIIPKLSSSKGLERIDYLLSKEQESKVALARRDNLDPVTWNLLNQNKNSKDVKIHSSGWYNLQARASFRSGNQPVSETKSVYIDNDNPNVEVNTQPLFFSPDNDGINEELDIRIIANDNYKLNKLRASVFRLETSAGKMSTADSLAFHSDKQIPLKTWEWTADEARFDERFSWNGQGSLGALVESATDYVIFVETIDEVGLKNVSAHQFLVDILVEKLADGRLRIILNSINFKYNSPEMEGEYEKVLDLLIRMLGTFPNYRIHVVGHTDSRGSQSYNQSLSFRRAERVKNYLVENNISDERLTIEGKGEAELLVENEKEVAPDVAEDLQARVIENNYRKNRRVEFFLKRNQ